MTPKQKHRIHSLEVLAKLLKYPGSHAGPGRIRLTTKIVSMAKVLPRLFIPSHEYAPASSTYKKTIKMQDTRCFAILAEVFFFNMSIVDDISLNNRICTKNSNSEKVIFHFLTILG